MVYQLPTDDEYLRLLSASGLELANGYLSDDLVKMCNADLPVSSTVVNLITVRELSQNEEHDNVQS